MFVGHAVLAFAIVGLLAGLVRPRREALVLGGFAAAYATVPDVDMSYALVGLLGVDGGTLAYATSFWAASTAVHRAITHSVVVGVLVAVLVGTWIHARRSGRSRHAAVAGLLALALTTVAAAASGPLGAAVMALFLLAALVVAEVATRTTDASPTTIGGVALVGLVSHPFGDLFTGHPPELLYPLDVTVFAHRVALHQDPTLHLLGAFGFELATLWTGLAVFCWLTDRSLRGAATLRAGAGAAYAVAALVIPAPTLEVSYPFVFSVLAVGTVGVVPRLRLPWRANGSRVVADGGARQRWPIGFERPDAFDALVTGLTAVTVAGAAYGVAYVYWLG